MERHELQLEGMTCNACSATIKSELHSRPDVSCVETDWQDGTVTFVVPDSAAEATVEEELATLGYDVVGHTLLRSDRVSR